jgi:hypothetical protein
MHVIFTDKAEAFHGWRIRTAMSVAYPGQTLLAAFRDFDGADFCITRRNPSAEAGLSELKAHLAGLPYGWRPKSNPLRRADRAINPRGHREIVPNIEPVWLKKATFPMMLSGGRELLLEDLVSSARIGGRTGNMFTDLYHRGGKGIPHERVVMMYIDGMTLKGIGAYCGVNGARIRQILMQICHRAAQRMVMN